MSHIRRSEQQARSAHLLDALFLPQTNLVTVFGMNVAFREHCVQATGKHHRDTVTGTRHRC